MLYFHWVQWQVPNGQDWVDDKGAHHLVGMSQVRGRPQAKLKRLIADMRGNDFYVKVVVGDVEPPKLEKLLSLAECCVGSQPTMHNTFTSVEFILSRGPKVVEEHADADPGWCLFAAGAGTVEFAFTKLNQQHAMQRGSCLHVPTMVPHKVVVSGHFRMAINLYDKCQHV